MQKGGFMRIKLLAKLLTIPLIVSAVAVTGEQPSQAQSRVEFFCGTYRGNPATIVRTRGRGDVALIIWKTTRFYQPEERCRIVSNRFQKYQRNGTLNFIVPGYANNNYVLCASRNRPTNQIQYCPPERILLTLASDEDANDIIRNIYDSTQKAYVSPVEQSAPVLVESEDGTNVGLDVVNMFDYSPTVEEDQ